MQAIIAACKNNELEAQVEIVVSDNSNAPGINYAKQLGFNTLVLNPKDFDSKKIYETKIVQALAKANVDLICLAGYMRLVGPTLLSAYEDKIINIHPSLLPSFKGLNPQQQALDCGVKYSGATVHYVNEELDSGAIIDQEIVNVKDTDTEQDLSDRILKIEHKLYPRALKKVIQNIKQGVSQ